MTKESRVIDQHRILALQKLLHDNALDALVLIAGVDGGDSSEVAQAFGYLTGLL